MKRGTETTTTEKKRKEKKILYKVCDFFRHQSASKR
jgi:hypothetical protein